MESLYSIPKTLYLRPPDEYNNPELYIQFQEKLALFKNDIQVSVSNNKFDSYYKFGDGDYNFLNKIPEGSAKPGKRALKKSYEKLHHKPFLDGYIQNNKFACLITNDNLNKFKKMFNTMPDYPSEIIYGLIANKWLLRNLSTKIGLIGAKPKINLIKELMEFEEYKNYLGLEKFNDYITIDQNFACDNLEKTKKNIKKQLFKSTSEVYLVGIGHVKSGLLHELKNYKKATYLDIGVGIDALAGVVNIYRPYFGLWQNYRIKNKSNYKKIDILINNFGSLGNVKVIQ